MDPILLQEFYREWKSHPRGSRARGEVVKKACLGGYSPSAIHKKFGQLESGESIMDVAAGTKRRGRARKSSQVAERERREAIAIAGIQQAHAHNGVSISMEMAALIAHREGLTVKQYDRHWVARAYKKYGLHQKQFNRPAPAVQLTSSYSNQCWVVDASPAEQVFFNFQKGRFESANDLTLNFKDKHLDEQLEKRGLTKVFIYAIVELYSRAYLVRYYAPSPRSSNAKYGSENATDWWDFILYAMYEKEPVSLGKTSYTIPIFGRPSIIYSDKGSGLIALREFFSRMGIRFETHMPGNSRAKGTVERRIGAWKQATERMLRRELVESLDQLREWSDQWMVYDNYKKGTFQKFVEGTRAKPVVAIDEKNVHDVTVGVKERTVTAYHTIRWKNDEYRITDPDVLPQQKVKVFMSPDGRLSVQDPKTWKIMEVEQEPLGPLKSEIGYTGYGDRAQIEDSELEINREEAIIEGKRYMKTMTLDTIRAPDIDPRENVRLMPVRNTTNLETHSAIAPEQFTSVESARLYLLTETGVTDDDLPDDLRKKLYDTLEGKLSMLGYVDGGFIMEMRNVLLDIRKMDRATGELYEGGNE